MSAGLLAAGPRGSGARAALLFLLLLLLRGLLLVRGVGRIGIEDVDRRAALDDLLGGRDLGDDLALGVDRLGRGLAEREILLAQRLLGLLGGHPDDVGDVDLARADGDQDRHRLALLGLRALLGRLPDHGPARDLVVDLLLLVGIELELGLGQLLLGLERRRLADHLRDEHLLRQAAEEQERQQRQQQDHRDQPPRQPRLLRERPLGRQQRPGGRARRAAAGEHLLAHLAGVELAHLRPLHLRRA